VNNNLTGQHLAGALARILSAGQKETVMTEIFERHQIVNTPKNYIKRAFCGYLPGDDPGWHRRC
jgi:hypothetical protein